MSYLVGLDPQARRQYDKLGQEIQDRVDAALLQMENDPRPPGVRKMKGGKLSAWRIRVGDYRILFTIDDPQRQIVVFDIDLRAKVYKDLS